MEAGNKYFHEVVHLLAATRFKRRFQSRFCQQESLFPAASSSRHFRYAHSASACFTSDFLHRYMHASSINGAKDIL